MRRSLLTTLAAITIAAGTSACGSGGPPSQVALGSDGGVSSSSAVAAQSTSTVVDTRAPVLESQELDPEPVASPPGDEAAGEQRETPRETDAGELDPSTSAGTVAAWVSALAAGDTNRAWALTHVASRDAFGGRAAFEASAPELAEGYGAWAGSPDAQYEATPLPAAGPGVDIVVLRGTITEEGPATERVDAVPVRQDADGAHQVDPFQDLVSEAGLEHRPHDGASVPATHQFEVFLAGGRNVSFIVDDEVLEVASEGADGDRQRVTGRSRQALAAGTHAFTVVVERDGALQAVAVLIRVS